MSPFLSVTQAWLILRFLLTSSLRRGILPRCCPAGPPPLQRKDNGKPAKSTTSEEFISILRQVDELLLNDEGWWDKLGYTPEEQAVLRQWRQELQRLQQQVQQHTQGVQQLQQQLGAAMQQRGMWASLLSGDERLLENYTVQLQYAHAMGQHQQLCMLQAAIWTAQLDMQMHRQQLSALDAGIVQLQQQEAGASGALAAVQQQLQAHLSKERPHPFFCFDNPNVHREGRHLYQAWCWEQPTYSPDFNKPVEHVIGNISSRIKDEVAEHSKRKRGDPGTDMKYWQGRVQAIFASQRPDSLSKDIASLTETWKAVADTSPGGAAGGWPPKKFR